LALDWRRRIVFKLPTSVFMRTSLYAKRGVPAFIITIDTLTHKDG